MRNLPVEIATAIAKRQGIVVRNLFWIKAKNRITGADETLGIWSGEDVQTFTVEGETRVYYGGGSFINFGELIQEAGLNIRKLVANVSPLSVEMQTVLREYEPKFAPVQVHLAFFDPETMTLLTAPFRVFKGWIDTMTINTPAVGDTASSAINMVSNARILTRLLPTKRSNENQKRRQADDTFFEYVALTGTIQTPWGTKGAGENRSVWANVITRGAAMVGNIK